MSASEWGAWECPICNEELRDPDSIYETSCHDGHIVILGPIGFDGRRRAWPNEPSTINE